MRALTVTQPWAQLIADGWKSWETRSWTTGYRGTVAIHAAKGWAAGDREYAADLGYDPESLPRGAVVAVATLAGVWTTERASREITAAEMAAGDYSRGRFAWHLTGVRKLSVPVSCRGALGLWTVPEDIRELLGLTA